MIKVYKLFLILTILFIPSVCWGGIDLNWDDDAVDCGSSFSPGSSSFTIYVLCKATSNNNFVLSSRSGSITEGYEFLIGSGGVAGNWRARIRGATGGGESNDKTGLNDGKYHSLFLTRDSSGGQCDFYVDGSLFHDDFGIPGTITNSQNLFIGRRGGNGFSGQILEMAYWDSDLTVDEISLIHNSKVKGVVLQIQPSNLQGYWALNGFSDGTALDTSASGYKDSSGNANHGTGIDADGDSSNLAETVLSYPYNAYVVQGVSAVAAAARRILFIN